MTIEISGFLQIGPYSHRKGRPKTHLNTDRTTAENIEQSIIFETDVSVFENLVMRCDGMEGNEGNMQ